MGGLGFILLLSLISFLLLSVEEHRVIYIRLKCAPLRYIYTRRNFRSNRKKAAEGTWMISGGNSKALCHFFPFEAHCDNASSPVLHWPICRVSEGGMSHCHVMGHEMPVTLWIIFFNHTCIAEISKRHWVGAVGSRVNELEQIMPRAAHLCSEESSLPISIFGCWRVGSFPSELGEWRQQTLRDSA